jgi:hypothetical protein
MDDDFGHLSVNAARLHLMIADLFMEVAPSNYTEIEVETQTDQGASILWYVSLQEGTLNTFVHDDIGYWVRQAVLFTPAQNSSYIRCHIGFSPETGRFLKLLGRGSSGDLSVWLESGPVTHILHLGHMV